jgi:hypothetical protein
MMIRVLLIGAFAAIGWFVFRRRNRLPLHIMLVFLLLIAGAIAVVFPMWTTDVANLLGVGRGADLVTYIAIVTVMFVLVHYYTKFVELQQQVTDLTRELAILRAEVDRVAPPTPAPSTSPDEPRPSERS